MDILNRFEKKKALMSNQELDIFQQIWEMLPTIQNKTLNDMTEILHISRQSFLRIAKKMGYKDSNEFLLDLNRQIVFSDITSTAKVLPSILEKNIHHIINHFDVAQIKTFIAYVEKSQRIFLISTGKAQKNQSEILSEILAKHGYFVVQVYDLFEISEIKSNLGDGDVVLVLTRTGTSTELLNAVQSINQTRASIVTITSLRSNPVSNLSNFTVFVNTQKIDGNFYELNALFFGLFGLIDFYLNEESTTKQLADEHQLVKNILSNYMIKMNSNLTSGNKELLMNLIQNPDLIFTSISTMSRQLSISTTSLFRLSKALGFNGFKQFRSSVRLEIKDFVPQKKQYESYQTLIQYFKHSVTDIMATDFSVAHQLLGRYRQICVVYHDKYTEILGDELIRMFFHTDKLIQKINCQTSSDYISNSKETLFIFLIKNEKDESDFFRAVSQVNDDENEVLVFSNKEINLVGYNLSGKIFFKDVPRAVRPFSDMWLMEFFFISYFY